LVEERFHIYTVSEITEEIKNILESNFYEILVRGEVSNFRPASSGHYYFVLKDENSQIKCVLFRSMVSEGVKRIRDGDEIVVYGGISLYPPRGEYQIIVNRVFLQDKKGALYLEFERLKEKLEKEGLFSKEHKIGIPSFPKKIGVATSKSGAAILDIIKTLRRRNPLVEILLYPVKVQGESASKEIVKAIEYFNRRKDIDVIIIGRGGGSIEDLWPFNEEIVARAIFKSKKPIISAVGHERDFTISDFVADKRAETPTAAARIVAMPLSVYLERIFTSTERLKRAVLREIDFKRNRIEILKKERGFFLFERRILNLYQDIDLFVFKIQMGMKRNLEKKRDKIFSNFEKLKFNSPIKQIPEKMDFFRVARERLIFLFQNFLKSKSERIEFLKRTIYNMSPQSVLARGYSITLDEEGRSIRNVTSLKRGDKIYSLLYEGKIVSKVEEIKEEKRWEEEKK